MIILADIILFRKGGIKRLWYPSKKGGYKSVKVYFIIIAVVFCIIVIHLVKKKNVKRHIMELALGNFIRFKTETEFRKEGRE